MTGDGDYPAAVRLLMLARRIYDGQAITAKQIQLDYGASKATAKRDMAALRRCLPVVTKRVEPPSDGGGGPWVSVRLAP